MIFWSKAGPFTLLLFLTLATNANAWLIDLVSGGDTGMRLLAFLGDDNTGDFVDTYYFGGGTIVRLRGRIKETFEEKDPRVDISFFEYKFRKNLSSLRSGISEFNNFVRLLRAHDRKTIREYSPFLQALQDYKLSQLKWRSIEHAPGIPLFVSLKRLASYREEESEFRVDAAVALQALAIVRTGKRSPTPPRLSSLGNEDWKLFSQIGRRVTTESSFQPVRSLGNVEDSIFVAGGKLAVNPALLQELCQQWYRELAAWPLEPYAETILGEIEERWKTATPEQRVTAEHWAVQNALLLTSYVFFLDALRADYVVVVNDLNRLYSQFLTEYLWTEDYRKRDLLNQHYVPSLLQPLQVR